MHKEVFAITAVVGATGAMKVRVRSQTHCTGIRLYREIVPHYQE